MNLQQEKNLQIKKIPVKISPLVHAAITKTHLIHPQVLHSGKVSVYTTESDPFRPYFHRNVRTNLVLTISRWFGTILCRFFLWHKYQTMLSWHGLTL
jgi:hypothetical protein